MTAARVLTLGGIAQRIETLEGKKPTPGVQSGEAAGETSNATATQSLIDDLAKAADVDGATIVDLLRRHSDGLVKRLREILDREAQVRGTSGGLAFSSTPGKALQLSMLTEPERNTARMMMAVRVGGQQLKEPEACLRAVAAHAPSARTLQLSERVPEGDPLERAAVRRLTALGRMSEPDARAAVRRARRQAH